MFVAQKNEIGKMYAHNVASVMRKGTILRKKWMGT